MPLRFPTYHPQGFALVGDLIFMTSVEVLEAPVKYPEPVDGYDRSPGKGIGHLFVIDRQGNLKKDIRSAKVRRTTRAGSTTTGRTCGCRPRSTGRTRGRSSNRRPEDLPA